MEKLEGLVAGLAELATVDDRTAFLQDHPSLRSAEGARVLCRTSVALTSRDLTLAGRLCDALDTIASTTLDSAILGYRDHARAAYLHQTGSDLRQATVFWQSAIQNFEAAELPNEAAITSSCAIPDFDLVGNAVLVRECETRARSYFEEVGDRLRLARLRSHIAILHFSKDEFKSAASLMEAAYAELVAENFGGSDLTTILNNLSVCYLSLGELPRAIYLLEKTRILCEERGFAEYLIRVHDNLASAKLATGDFTAALQLVERQSGCASLRPNTELYYLAALTEAEVLLELCLPAQAHHRATLAYEGLQRIGRPREAGRALLIAGRSMLARGRAGLAMNLFDEAMSCFASSGSSEASRLCRIEQAKALLETGALDASSSLLEPLVGTDAPRAMGAALDCLLLHARLLFVRGDLDQARRLGEQALARSALLAYGVREGEALRLLGEVYEALGLLGLAQGVLSRYQHSIDRLRRGLPTGELQVAFLTDKSDVFQSLFSLALGSGSSTSTLFRIAETSKSRALSEILFLRLDDQLRVTGGCCDGALVELWEGLRTALRNIDRLTPSFQSSTQVGPIRDDVLAAERATRHLMDLTHDNTGTRSQDLPTLSQVSAFLPRSCTLVEFYIARGLLFAFVVSSDGHCVKELGSTARIRKLSRLTQFSLEHVGRTEVQRTDHALLAYLEELYELLWGEISPIVTDPRIVIVPHGFLHQFPFHALFDGKSFLIDNHAISYSPSASVFYMARRRAPKPTKGSVVVGLSDAMVPAIADEVREVAEILPESRVFLNGAATQERLSPELPTARFIHIAAHGGFDPSQPQFSSVRLEDGPITVNDLKRTELSAELVVLSGCETGRAALRGCDELVGLTQALLQAGARSALVSLWKVEDKTTATFMRRFHERLSDDEGRDETLRQAIRLQKDAFPHPSLWAPFVLVGDPDPPLKNDASSTRC